MAFPGISLELPKWLQEQLAGDSSVYRTDEDKMELVVALSRRNVEEKTGGPFGAAVFDMDSHRLVAPGVNVVVEARCSAAHAEVVALSVAQKVVGSHDLGGPGESPKVLVSSTEPCAMCLGSVPWSGVRRLVCGATGDDAERIGMDEGAKPQNWVSTLEDRAIDVRLAVSRSEAAKVLEQYVASGGTIYNGRRE